MTPRHHLSEELLVGYAAGTTPEALSLFVAAHASMCPACRQDIGTLELAGGACLEEEAAATLGAGALASVLARLDEPVAPEPPPPRPVHLALPQPLWGYLPPEARWRFLAPGAQQVPIPLGLNGNPVRLVRLAAGFRVPLHGHRGNELTLIVSGTLEDIGERYAAGDVIVRTSEQQHVQRVGREDACVSLIVKDAPAVPLTLFSRFYNRLIGSF